MNVERSAPKGAVFLSYASQDAEAAKRIADALRAAGVEVWFDQNELVGGDAWDQKIRKQIGSCALFVPIISANTQARAEGYFRLEWRLADKRTELMGRSKAFLLPVCIDDTRDGDADVPDSFLAVQWTRLRSGETTPAFVARVARLLDGNETPRRSESRVEGSVAPVAPKPSLAKSWLRWEAMVAVTVLVAGGLAYWWQSGRGTPASARPHTAAPAAVAAPSKEVVQPNPPTGPVLSPARALVAKAAELHENLDAATRADFELAGDMFKQALELAPLDAEVWAHYSWYCNNVYGMGVDRSPERDAEMKRAADKAIKLDPRSVMARFAWANYYRRVRASLDESIRILREVSEADTPYRGAMLRVLAIALRRAPGHSEEEAFAALDRAIAQPGGDPHAWVVKGDYHWYMNRPAEAEAAYDQSLAARPTPRVLTRKAMFLVFQHGDLEGAAKLMAKIPGEFLQEDRAVGIASQLALWQRKPEACLDSLARFSRDYVEDGNYGYITGPKGLFAGHARWLQGKPDLARLEWEEGLRVVDQRLTSRRTDVNLLSQRMELLAFLGRREEAETAMRLVVQLQPWRGDGAQGLIDAWSGQLDAVFARLASATLNHDTLLELRHDPKWEPLRRDPRYQALFAAAPAQAPVTVAPDAKSVAVLAFANLSDDKANEYFSDGISEELLNVLAKVPGLKVTARTSAFHFKGKDTPIPEIAKQLGVAYVVEGSVRKAGDKVRITAQLIKAADGFHVWSDTFTRDLKDIFAVQDEIAGLIAKNLELKLGQAVGPAGAAEFNPEAFRLYLQGREAWNRRDAAGFQQAELLFHRALELEPRFARAHAALADVWMLASTEPVGGYAQRQSPLLMRIIAKAEQAVAMDGKSAEAHASLGHALDYAWRFADSQRALRRAIELNPNYASAHQWLGRVLLELGQLDEALASLQRAAELDPLSHRILDNYADALECAGRLEEAWAMLGRAAALHPSGVQIRCKQALLLQRLGRRDEALAAARALAADTAADDPDYRHSTAVAVLSACGETAEAEASLRRIAQDSEDYPIALLNIGRTREFIAHLDYASINWVHNFWFHREFAAARAEPGVRAWVAKVGLAEALTRAESWTAAHHGKNPAGRK